MKRKLAHAASQELSDFNDYLHGNKLYGDDFSDSEIEQWLQDEEEGYYNLTSKDRSTYVYGYHALNWLHGYSSMPERKFESVLGIGSAYGDELQPIALQASRITILEPSDKFRVADISGIPVKYVKPRSSGHLPFRSESFDLISCLSVLHHIPNVSRVVSEIWRCLVPGGYALLREPIVSMGDWRKPRMGLTKRERGIPIQILRNIIVFAGFVIKRERKCVFPVTRRLQAFMRSPLFNSRFWVTADWLICMLPVWSKAYHPQNLLQRLHPNAVFFVVQKPFSTKRNWLGRTETGIVF